MNGVTKRFSIDVGGEIFSTTRETLERSPFLKALLQNVDDCDTACRENQLLFIDRDPTGFDHVLRFLRDSNYVIPSEFEYELEFYGLRDEREEKSEFLPPLKIESLNTHFLYVNHSKEVKEWQKSINHKIECLNNVVEINATTISETASVFRLPRMFDTIVCVLYDFNSGPIKRGSLSIGSREHCFIAEGIAHFPSNVVISPFQEITITMYGRIEKLHLLAKTYLNTEKRNKIIYDGFCCPEENIMMKNCDIGPIVVDNPPWYKKSLHDEFSQS